MRILIADDDPVYRELVQSLAERWGFETLCASDGSGAWDILQTCAAPPMVILDWMMPGVDGYEICRRVRNAGGSYQPYILLMTSNKIKEDIAKVIVAGADDYLIKPFDPLDLQIHLRTAKRIVDLQEELALKSPPAQLSHSA